MLLSCMYCVIVHGMCAVFCRSVVYIVRLYMCFWVVSVVGIFCVVCTL